MGIPLILLSLLILTASSSSFFSFFLFLFFSYSFSAGDKEAPEGARDPEEEASEGEDGYPEESVPGYRQNMQGGHKGFGFVHNDAYW
jgi:hypothetical protein